jgi:DNA-binding IscR family transcriptional regulator
MGEMFANDMPPSRPKDIANKEDIHHPNPSMLSCEPLLCPVSWLPSSGGRFHLSCDSLLCMAQSGRFGLSLRILTVLAAEPDLMHTSAAIAEELSESAVMVRRCFLLLQKGGLIEQRKGPHGGAKLKLPAKQIGLGDIYLATEGDWLVFGDATLSGLLKRVRAEGVLAMNETTLSQMLKRIKKKAVASGSQNGAAVKSTAREATA